MDESELAAILNQMSAQNIKVTIAGAHPTRPVDIEEAPVTLTKANIRTRLTEEILLDSEEERIEEAKIIAINKDPNAPIFKIAELGIIGDALAILPKLIDEIELTSAATQQKSLLCLFVSKNQPE